MKNDQEKTFEEVLRDMSWRNIVIPFVLSLLVAAAFIFFSVRTAAQENREPKKCVVTEVLEGGTKSDCGGWKPAKGEKMMMPAEVNKRLKVGDTFYFVWKETRWVAEIRQ